MLLVAVLLGGVAVDAALEKFVAVKFQKAGVWDFMKGDDALLGVDPNAPDLFSFATCHGQVPPFLKMLYPFYAILV